MSVRLSPLTVQVFEMLCGTGILQEEITAKIMKTCTFFSPKSDKEQIPKLINNSMNCSFHNSNL